MDGTGYLATSTAVVFRIDFYVDRFVIANRNPWFHRVEIRDSLKDVSVSMHKRDEMKIRKLCSKNHQYLQYPVNQNKYWVTLFRHLKCCEPAQLQTELALDYFDSF